jgi:hypothetical protein
LVTFGAVRSPRTAERVALGFSVHTGWAAVVAVSADSPGSITILDRRRMEMIRGDDPQGPRFVYHAARELSLEAAEKFVHASEQRALAGAREALGAAVESLRSAGHPPVACALVGGNPTPPGPLEAILRNHSAVHTAEGALFRQAVRRAGEALGIPVTEVRSKELVARAARVLGVTASRVPDLLARVGQQAGRPWSKDQKDATLVALVALLDSSGVQRQVR